MAVIAAYSLVTLSAVYAAPEPKSASATPASSTSSSSQAAAQKASREQYLPVLTGVASAIIYSATLKKPLDLFCDNFTKEKIAQDGYSKPLMYGAVAAVVFGVVQSIIAPVKKTIFDNECSPTLERKKNENMTSIDTLVTLAGSVLLIYGSALLS